MRKIKLLYKIWKLNRKYPKILNGIEAVSYLADAVDILGSIGHVELDFKVLVMARLTTSYRKLNDLTNDVIKFNGYVMEHGGLKDSVFKNSTLSVSGVQWLGIDNDYNTNVDTQITRFIQEVEKTVSIVISVCGKNITYNNAVANGPVYRELVPLTKEVNEVIELTLLAGGFISEGNLQNIKSRHNSRL